MSTQKGAITMESLREIFGAEPIKNDDGTYWPSHAAMTVAVPKTSGYTETSYPNADAGGDKRVLFLCTQEDTLECTNGKVFKTGNHPAELFVVALHLEKAGFTIDFATPTGGPVAVELFAVPTDDDVVSSAMSLHANALEHPLSMADVLADLGDNSPYVAVYLPGGHGATQGIPFDEHVKGVLEWFISHERHVITICHGPAILQALQLGRAADPDTFPLAGYEMVAFRDSTDKMLTLAGYLPGEMPYFFGEKIEAMGIKIVNHLTVGGVHKDRRLLSGDSPMAADKLGKLAAQELLAVTNPTQAHTT